MKKIISFLLVAIFLISFASCSYNETGVTGNPNQYEVVYNRPAGFHTPAPEGLRLEWDIKSVRNPYDEITNAENGDYSMPVYRFDTYTEYSHLCDILGTNHVPTVAPVIDDTNYVLVYNDYRIGTFENYSLLLGWFTVETCHSVDCYDIPETYVIDGDSLILFVPKHDCDCSAEKTRLISEMIWVSVPKDELEQIDKISFVLEKCFLSDAQPDEEAPDTDQTDEEAPEAEQPDGDVPTDETTDTEQTDE